MRSLTRVSRYTARFHLPAAGLEGVVAGIFSLNDIVLRKTFGAGPGLITLLVMVPPVSQLLSVVWGNLMEGREKRGFILRFGLVGRLALLTVALAVTPMEFVVPVAFSITMSSALIPALNAMYQTNYTSPERGRVFGLVMSVTALATIAGSIGAGAWLDHDDRAYRFLYPLAGLFGALSAVIFYRIRARRSQFIERARRHAAAIPAGRFEIMKLGGDWLGDVQRGLRDPWSGIRDTFREDPSFFRFEIAFMIYGVGFMMLQPVIPIFLVDDIRVQYSEVATARGLIFWGIISVLSPFFGWLLDRTNVMRVGVIGFAILAVYPLWMAASRSVSSVYGAFALYGLAMSAVNIAWTMGPIFFAGRRDAARYMGVHVMMVGIRGLVGNPLGLGLMTLVGSRGTFLVSGLFFAAAAVIMAGLERRHGRAA